MYKYEVNLCIGSQSGNYDDEKPVPLQAFLKQHGRPFPGKYVLDHCKHLVSHL